MYSMLYVVSYDQYCLIMLFSGELLVWNYINHIKYKNGLSEFRGEGGGEDAFAVVILYSVLYREWGPLTHFSLYPLFPIKNISV